MPDSIYDKLGDLLNEALESGTIPNTENSSENESERCESFSTSEQSEKKTDNTSFNFNDFNFINKTKTQTGKVYKPNNYNFVPEYPENIKQALFKLAINDFSKIDIHLIKKAYRKILKTIHPDIQNKDTSEKTREIIQAYEDLLKYFN